MSTSNSLPPAPLLWECFNYDPDTGNLVWRKTLSPNAPAGSVAGNAYRKGGRIVIGLLGRQYQAAHLVWVMFIGAAPAGVIDHRDGDPANNRIENLRDVSCQWNAQNQKSAHQNNSSKLLGVSYRKKRGKFEARINFDGKKHYLGMFATADEARAAYVAAKQKLHEGYIP